MLTALRSLRVGWSCGISELYPSFLGCCNSQLGIQCMVPLELPKQEVKGNRWRQGTSCSYSNNGSGQTGQDLILAVGITEIWTNLLASSYPILYVFSSTWRNQAPWSWPSLLAKGKITLLLKQSRKENSSKGKWSISSFMFSIGRRSKRSNT